MLEISAFAFQRPLSSAPSWPSDPFSAPSHPSISPAFQQQVP